MNSKGILSDDVIDRVIHEVNDCGYSLVKNYLHVDEISEYRDLVARAIENFEINDNPFREKEKFHIHDLLVQDKSFLNIIEDPRLQQLLEVFLSPFWTLYAFTSSSIPPAGVNYSRRVHNDCPRHIPNYISNMGVIWPLDDYTESSGVLYVAPHSHLEGHILSDGDFEKRKIPIFCTKGDLIVFNARLVHRTDMNRTSKFRHALTMNSCRPYMKSRFNWVKMIPKEFLIDRSERCRRIVGYHSRVPNSLGVYFVPPEERLFKAGQE